MDKEEKEYIVTEIQKCDNYLMDNKMNIIFSTIFALVSAFDITIAFDLLLVKILGPIFLSGSLFTIGYSIYEKAGLKLEKERLKNIIKFDDIEGLYVNDLGGNIENLRTNYLDSDIDTTYINEIEEIDEENSINKSL